MRKMAKWEKEFRRWYYENHYAERLLARDRGSDWALLYDPTDCVFMWVEPLGGGRFRVQYRWTNMLRPGEPLRFSDLDADNEVWDSEEVVDIRA